MPDAADPNAADPNAADPLALLHAGISEARATGAVWSHALTLATVGSNGRPSARAVVLRSLDQRGLVFFTDEGSRKGRQLAENPHAAAVFLWPTLRREARVEGAVARLGDDEADTLFAESPAETRLPLWAWRQGEVVADEAELEGRLERTRRDRQEDVVPRPPYWRGYRLNPTLVEFWQERPGGLHVRNLHLRTADGWKHRRLAP